MVILTRSCTPTGSFGTPDEFSGDGAAAAVAVASAVTVGVAVAVESERESPPQLDRSRSAPIGTQSHRGLTEFGRSIEWFGLTRPDYSLRSSNDQSPTYAITPRTERK
jgi:hypothetical protein